MPRELVPELHDILKLTTLKHNFEDFDPYHRYVRDTPTWHGVFQHHCDEAFPGYPTDRDTFLLHMADGLAANFSRHPQNIRHDTAWTVHRLWRPHEVLEDKRLKQHQSIAEMLEILAAEPSFEKFFERYREIFQTRSEDAHPGMNVTTVETHVRLVGCFFRFLKRSKLPLAEEEVIEAATGGVRSIGNLRKRKQNEWQIYLIRCRLRLLPNPFRARDMNVFGFLQEFMNEVSARCGENILFLSRKEILLYSDTLSILDELKQLATPKGIALEVERSLQRLDMLTLKFRKPEWETLHADLPATLLPPICEVCQMQAATRVWPDDLTFVPEENTETAQGKDRLCDTCFSIRSRPSQLKKLAHWDEWAEGRIMWARFGLDFSELQLALEALYLAYLRSLDPSTAEDKAEVRFSLVAEFQQEYQRFLNELQKRVVTEFGEDRVEVILPDLFCIQARSGKDVFSVLRCLHESGTLVFPALLEIASSPLRVSLSFSDVKHPFFEVWRKWQGQQSEIEVTTAQEGELQLEVRNLEKFLNLADFPFRKTALHNLAHISEISQQLAELRFIAKGEKGEKQTFDRLGEFLPLGLSFQGILTLAKLAGTN